MPITPDTKNWTFTAERECDECHYDGSTIDVAAMPALIRSAIAEWPAVLSRPDVRERPNDSTWSPLEYAAHVRDVLRLYDTRLALMLADEDPLFENWDQDAAAEHDRYNEQDPAQVALDIDVAGERIAEAFAALDAPPSPVWTRRGRRSDGAVFTIDSFARYFLHDIVHHAWDVRLPVK